MAEKRNSPAKIAANNRYKQKTYKKFAADIKTADYIYLTEKLKSMNVSKAVAIVNCICYCIDNNVDIANYSPKNSGSNEQT